MKGYAPLEIARDEHATVDRVDCGTCPVTLACAVNQGGNGFVFKCCGATGFERTDAEGVRELFLIDCAAHKFERRTDSDGLPDCPMCTGGVLLAALLNLTDPCRWIPTVHASVPAETRLDVWRKELPIALERALEIVERKEPR